MLEKGFIVGRIFTVQTAPQGRPCVWASGHSAATIKRAAHGYKPTREAAMGGVRQVWRREMTTARSLERRGAFQDVFKFGAIFCLASSRAP